MSKRRLRNSQRTRMSTKMRIIIGASIFAAASLLLIVVFNITQVKETRAFASGDYKAKGSGEWDDVSVWETYDGSSWSEASMPPGPEVKTIVITAGNKITITEEQSLQNILIDEGGSLVLEANSLTVSKMNGKGGIVCNGEFHMGNCIIEGNGDFLAGATASLFIGSDMGIDKKAETGNIQLKGKKEINKDALFIFNGSIKQNTGNGIPAVIRNLVIDNSAGVVLSQNYIITDKLFLKTGVLYTDKFALSIGTGATAPAVIERINGTVFGKIKRWYGPVNNSTIMFPMSDLTNVNLFSFTTDVQEYQKGVIELEYHAGKADQSSQSPFAARQVVIGIGEEGFYTAFMSNGPDEAWLKIINAVGGERNENKVNWKIMKPKQPVATVSEKGTVSQTDNFENIVSGPNPFREKFFVRFYSDVNTLANIQLMTNTGQILYNEPMNVEKGNNLFEYNDNKDLKPGVYILRISNPSEIHTVKVIKDK